MNKEKILIVCYTFPPDAGIGGKRWSKFSKQFAGLNYDVHVITRKKNKNIQFDFAAIGLEKITIHEIADNYPIALTQPTRTFWQKTKYKLSQYYALFKHKGAIYDRSIFMEKELQKKMTELITQLNIEYVFVTSAPFYLAVWASRLKSRLNFCLTIDLRDPWTWGQSYGYENISLNRKNYDQSAEKEVMLGADIITSPSAEIVRHLKQTYQISAHKFYHLPHGVDIEDLKDLQRYTTPHLNKDQWKCVYAGTLYDNYDVFLKKIMHALQNLRNSDPSAFEKFVFDIYATNDFSKHELMVEEFNLSDKIKFHQPIHETELFRKLVNYNCSIVFFPEKYKDFISTKFYELIYLQLPILYVGNPGVLSQFIQENNVGKFLNFNSIEEQFTKQISVLINEGFKSNFKINDYNFDQLTNKLMKLVHDYWQKNKPEH